MSASRYFAVLAALVMSMTTYAQTAEDRARIDYTAAKRAIEQKQFSVALKKLETVMQVLGEQPELLTLAAECAMALKDTEKASSYIEKAFAVADDRFRASDTFERLVNVAAELEIGKAVAGTKWKRPHDSLCSTEWFPVSPTYERRYIGSSTFDGDTMHDERVAKVVSIDRDWVRVKSDTGAGGGYVETWKCDDRGVTQPDTRGYELPSALKVGLAWTYERTLGASTVSARCSAAAAEKIVVAAGEFDTITVECRESSRSGEQTCRKWLASGVGQVRMECNFVAGVSGNVTSELKEWRP